MKKIIIIICSLLVIALSIIALLFLNKQLTDDRYDNHDEIIEDEAHLEEDESEEFKKILDEASERLNFDFNGLYSFVYKEYLNEKYDVYRLDCKYNQVPEEIGIVTNSRTKLSNDSLSVVIKKLASAKEIDRESVFGIEGCPSRYVSYSIDDGTDEGSIFHLFYLDNKTKVLLLAKDYWGVFIFNTADETEKFIESLK